VSEKQEFSYKMFCAQDEQVYYLPPDHKYKLGCELHC